jgi:cobalt/nickel transport system ATP-binding protein
MTPLIEVRGLRYRYDDGTQALDGVDFRLYPGETVALLGANGSGKTTFVLHLNGLLSGEGAVRVCGLDVVEENFVAVRRKIGIVFQDPDEQLFMPTVLEDAAFGPLNMGLPPEAALARAREALARAGVEEAHARAPYHLSAGEKRRVAIAGVLAMTPEILALDEPTTWLDPPGQRGLLEVLASLPQAKVIATHDTRFAAALATRAVFFERGRIIDEGPVGEVAARRGWSV